MTYDVTTTATVFTAAGQERETLRIEEKVYATNRVSRAGEMSRPAGRGLFGVRRWERQWTPSVRSAVHA